MTCLLACDWLKPNHVTCLLACDWLKPNHVTCLLACDWLKPNHVTCLLACDWLKPNHVTCLLACDWLMHNHVKSLLVCDWSITRSTWVSYRERVNVPEEVSPARSAALSSQLFKNMKSTCKESMKRASSPVISVLIALSLRQRCTST